MRFSNALIRREGHRDRHSFARTVGRAADGFDEIAGRKRGVGEDRTRHAIAFDGDRCAARIRARYVIGDSRDARGRKRGADGRSRSIVPVAQLHRRRARIHQDDHLRYRGRGVDVAQ